MTHIRLPIWKVALQALQFNLSLEFVSQSLHLSNNTFNMTSPYISYSPLFLVHHLREAGKASFTPKRKKGRLISLKVTHTKILLRHGRQNSNPVHFSAGPHISLTPLESSLIIGSSDHMVTFPSGFSFPFFQVFGCLVFVFTVELLKKNQIQMYISS